MRDKNIKSKEIADIILEFFVTNKIPTSPHLIDKILWTVHDLKLLGDTIDPEVIKEICEYVTSQNKI